MDRRMFDMSEFYRSSGAIQQAYESNEMSCMNTENSGDCTDPLTMVFINMQPLESVYPLNEAYDIGTLFPNLNKPFYGGMSNER